MPKLLEFQRKGVKVPELESKPEVKTELQIVFKAFSEILNRNSNVTLEGISKWLDLYEITDTSERKWFYRLISVLDDERLKKSQGKQNGS